MPHGGATSLYQQLVGNKSDKTEINVNTITYTGDYKGTTLLVKGVNTPNY